MLYLYTDGGLSTKFDQITIAWAFCVVENNRKLVYEESGIFDGPDEIKNYRNVAAEVLAARAALQWAVDNQQEEIWMVFDYLGVSAWPTGEWEAKNSFTEEYRHFVNQLDITINWKHVKGHSGVKFNEYVDSLVNIEKSNRLTKLKLKIRE